MQSKPKKVDRRSAVDRKVSKPRHWHRKEDQLLRAAVAQYGNKHWKKIAEHVPGRNHTQCLQRWSKVLAPGLKKGQWSVFEDQLLVELAKGQMESCKILHAPSKFNWGIISKLIPGRTPKQCRERWVSNLNPEIKKGDWSAEEDRRILELNKMYPYKWATIAKNLKGRTENAVKIRFKSLTRTMERKRKRAKGKEPGWREKGTSTGTNSGSEDLQRTGSSSGGSAGSRSATGAWSHTQHPVKRQTMQAVKVEQRPVLNAPGAGQALSNGHGANERVPVIGHEAAVTLSLLDMYVLTGATVTPFNYIPSPIPVHMSGTPYLLVTPNPNLSPASTVNMNQTGTALTSNGHLHGHGQGQGPNHHMPMLVSTQHDLNSGRSNNRQRNGNDKQISVRFNGSESWANKYQMTRQGRVVGFPECGPEDEESSFSVSVLVKDVEATRGKVFDLYLEFCLFDAEGSVKVDNILKKEDIAKLLRTEENPGNAWIRGEYRSRAIKSGEIVFEYTVKTGCEGWVYGDHFVEHPLAESGAVNRHSLRAYVLFPFSATGEYAQCIQIAKSPDFLILPDQHLQSR